MNIYAQQSGALLLIELDEQLNDGTNEGLFVCLSDHQAEVARLKEEIKSARDTVKQWNDFAGIENEDGVFFP